MSVRLDFDRWHPLDHALRDCVGYPGGRWRHAEMRWEFHWRDALTRRTLCRLGWHEPVLMWIRKGGRQHSMRACRACFHKMPSGTDSAGGERRPRHRRET